MARQHDEYLKIRRQFQMVSVAAVTTLVVGAVFYRYVENFSWVDAFYFCVITLTTVGYGDIYPVTDAGKIFTMFYVLAGIGIIATFAQLFIKHAIERRKDKLSNKETTK